MEGPDFFHEANLQEGYVPPPLQKIEKAFEPTNMISAPNAPPLTISITGEIQTAPLPPNMIPAPPPEPKSPPSK